ncbi:Heat shock protein GrpE [Candidatus Syntrophocurvum alkaliphilum]|uniref:Protein GrpE n=1 Tax=Candidatus Syntrophocurvum alkaliphilum TaxID=2293317 RepID=A0A6I6DB73_9FIRM|nr:nucleotide exchange factor GrpE [Candidatus Syntrophocurvum alkaliphilum]QGT99998.1 Heat shock protein GrpE [Candidatus Syntrophocurvum alkaliphilum]
MDEKNLKDKNMDFSGTNPEETYEETKGDNHEKDEKEIDEITVVKQELEKMKEQSQNNYELYLRAVAETENIRKRTQKEREEYTKFASLPFIKNLLPILDDLERAIAMSKNTNDLDSLVKGVEMTVGKINEILKNEGVEIIESVGEPFDPEVHQPLLVEESEEYPENTVIEEMQKGYKLHDRLIRPSLVKVSK